jgi:hypothetical protein
MSNISICNVTIMPAGEGFGDHHLFVVDFVAVDIIGLSPPRVVRPTSRKLNTKLPHVTMVYACLLEEKIIKHRLIEQVGCAHSSTRLKQDVMQCLNCLDQELGQNMEKKFGKINQVVSPSFLKHLPGFAGHRSTLPCFDIMPAKI